MIVNVAGGKREKDRGCCDHCQWGLQVAITEIKSSNDDGPKLTTCGRRLSQGPIEVKINANGGVEDHISDFMFHISRPSYLVLLTFSKNPTLL